MDSVPYNRSPGRDDRRRLSPRIESVSFDQSTGNTVVVGFSEDMDTVAMRLPKCEFWVYLGLARVRFLSITPFQFNAVWRDKRSLVLLNPFTVTTGPLMPQKCVYVRGNLRAERRFMLWPGTQFEQPFIPEDYTNPSILSGSWNAGIRYLTLEFDQNVFYNGDIESILLNDGGTIYTAVGLISGGDGSSTTVVLAMEEYATTGVDPGQFLVNAGVFATVYGRSNDFWTDSWKAL